MKTSLSPIRNRRELSRWLSAYAAVLAALILGGAALAAEPVLEIAVGASVQRLTRTELLKHPSLQAVDVANDVAYKRPMRYRALPLNALIHPLPASGTVQFTATDGFVANIPTALLSSAAQPWIAVEPADAPWPPLKPGGVSAGPFYLVWLAPERAGISPEQWPYQVARIAEALPLEARYPQIVPRLPSGENAAAMRGLHVFVANCMVCHQINGGGDATVGPDLNKPFSPIEYFQEPYLRHLIRDPASVRDWRQRSMTGFSKEVLSESMLDDLLAYLRLMAAQRRN